MKVEKEIKKYKSFYQFLFIYCGRVYFKRKGINIKKIKTKSEKLSKKDPKKLSEKDKQNIMKTIQLRLTMHSVKNILTNSETNKLIKQLININPKLISKKINTPYIENPSLKSKEYAIQFVIMKMNLKMLKFIINNGNADIHQCSGREIFSGNRFVSPVISTIKSQKFDMFKFIINKYNLNSNYSICNGEKIYLLNTAITYYIFEKGYKFVKYILDNTKKIYIPRKDLAGRLIEFGYINPKYDFERNLKEVIRCNKLKNIIIDRAKLSNKNIKETLYYNCWIYGDMIKKVRRKEKKEMILKFFKEMVTFHKKYLKDKKNLLKYKSYENETIEETIIRSGVKGIWLDRMFEIL